MLTTKHKNILHLVAILMILAICSCGSSVENATAEQEPQSVALMVLPPELKAVSTSLSSTLTVYSTTITQIFHRSLSFVEDSDGNTIVTSPPLDLTKTNHYRFVVVFYWDEVVFAYVDTVLQVSALDTTNLAYEASDIVYDTADPNASLSVPMVYQQDSQNLSIADLSIIQSEENKNLLISARLEGANSDTSISLKLSEGDNEFADLDLSDDLIIGDSLQTLNTSIETLAFPSNNIHLSLIATDGDGNESSLSTDVELN